MKAREPDWRGVFLAKTSEVSIALALFLLLLVFAQD